MSVLDWGKARALRMASGLVSPGGTRGRLLILCYHRVLPETDPLMPAGISRDVFDMQMRVVAEYFTPLPLHEAVERLKSGSLPARAVSVTFDDGYADNLSVALPVLQRHQVPATLFVACNYLDGGRMWNDTVAESVRRARGDTLDLSEFGLPNNMPIDTAEQRGRTALKTMLHLRRLPSEQRSESVEKLADMIGAELPNDLMLTSAQLVEFHQAGMEIGAHTLSHPILSRLSDEQAEREIRASRETLQSITGGDVAGFAYPNGQPEVDYTQAHVRAVDRVGYTYAVSTAHGSASVGSDPFQLPRLDPWDKTPVRMAARLIKECTMAPARVA